MSAQKGTPGRGPPRRGRDPVVFQHLGDRASRDTVVEVLQCALDATVAPGWIVCGHPHNERRDLLHRPGPAWPFRRERPLPGDQPPVPPQDRVGRHDGRHIRRTRRPSRWPFAARRRRCSSVNRMRRPFSCSLRTRFSSTRYSMTCCWWRLTHPARGTSSSRNGESSAVIGRSYRATFRPLCRVRAHSRVFGHYALQRVRSAHRLRLATTLFAPPVALDEVVWRTITASKSVRARERSAGTYRWRREGSDACIGCCDRAVDAGAQRLRRRTSPDARDDEGVGPGGPPDRAGTARPAGPWPEAAQHGLPVIAVKAAPAKIIFAAPVNHTPRSGKRRW
jgi:hypothetical protein